MLQVRLSISLETFGATLSGGPLIDKYAKKGNHNTFSFAEPKVDVTLALADLKQVYYTLLKRKQNKILNL